MHISPPRCIVSKAYLSDSSLAPASRQKLKKETGFSPLKIVKKERKRKEMEEKNETRKKNVLHPSRTRRNKFDCPIRPVEPEFYLRNPDQTASCQLDRAPPLKKDQSLSVYLVARTIICERFVGGKKG